MKPLTDTQRLRKLRHHVAEALHWLDSSHGPHLYSFKRAQLVSEAETILRIALEETKECK